MLEERKFLEIVANVLHTDIGNLSMKSRFTEDLGADSLQIFRIMTDAMELFDQDIEDHAAFDAETIGEAFSYFDPAEALIC